MRAWKLTTDWGFSVMEDPRVPLKVEELEDDKVVMGVGMSLPVMCERLGALGLL